MEPIKILIADDHGQFRQTVREFLGRIAGVSVIGEAVDGIDVILKVQELQPDVILMDIAMPHRNGLDATKIIKHRWPHKFVIIMTAHGEDIYRLQAQEARADGFVLKYDLKPNLEKAFSKGSTLIASVRASTDRFRGEES